MQRYKVLFYDEDPSIPIDHRCISRFVQSFSNSYQKTVATIIGKSENLDYEAFRSNVVILMKSFKMTRRGAFHGVSMDSNTDDIISLCWRQVGDELKKLKEYSKENYRGKRSRILVELSSESRNYVIQKIDELFRKLTAIKIQTGRVTPVGASKVLFAVLPEIALPVDTSEWKHVFRTENYGEILSTMSNEIEEWEKSTEKNLESLDEHPTTLPAIYNIMAMAARP